MASATRPACGGAAGAVSRVTAAARSSHTVDASPPSVGGALRGRGAADHSRRCDRVGSAARGSLAALPVPASDHQFTAGDETTIHLQAGESKVVDAGDPSGARAGTCTVKSPARLRPYDGDLTVGPWHAVGTVSADSAGNYRLECGGPDGLSYSIGGDADTELTIGVSGAVAGDFAALVEVVLVVVTAVRRRRPSAR